MGHNDFGVYNIDFPNNGRLAIVFSVTLHMVPYRVI